MEESTTLTILREVENFTTLQTQLANHMKEGITDLTRAKYTAGRKFQFGTKFVPNELTAHPSCTVQTNAKTGKILELKNTFATTNTTELRNRKQTSTSIATSIATSTSTSITRDPALLFGSLSPPTLKSCSAHFKLIVELTIKLAKSKQRIEHLQKKL